jgi:hypothetical protein
MVVFVGWFESCVEIVRNTRLLWAGSAGMKKT